MIEEQRFCYSTAAQAAARKFFEKGVQREKFFSKNFFPLAGVRGRSPRKRVSKSASG